MTECGTHRKEVKDGVGMFVALGHISLAGPNIPLSHLLVHFGLGGHIMESEQEGHTPECLHLCNDRVVKGVDKAWKVDGSVALGSKRRNNEASVV